MRLSRLAKITMVGLASHAFRSFLAALGVVLGVGAVVGMMAISEGAKRESLARITAMGIDNIVVVSVEPPLGEDPSSSSRRTRVEAFGIRSSELSHIRNTFENVRLLVPVRDMRKEVFRGAKSTDVRVMATTPDLLAVTSSELVDSRSRFLTTHDGTALRPVCVLGTRAARTLFGFNDPIGQNVSAGGASFTVVGLLENRQALKLAGALDLDNLVYVPFETGNALFGESLLSVSRGFRMTQVDIDYLYITVRDIGQLNNTVARLRTYLEQTHKVRDYRIQVPYELLRQQQATQRIFTIVMASIAAISLLVGGIGIMNIMLANIYERTREIGTRRALGAKRRDILMQFLSESVLLSGGGGLTGLVLGVSIAAIVEAQAGMTTVVTGTSVAVSLAVAVLTGVTFGTYPAWKAANLDPIEALRHE